MTDGEGSHLWTPWRMAYVQHGAKETGCVFCNRLTSQDDVSSLILHRAERFFIIMNLYPYNTGHLMIVPSVHVATPEDAEPETLAAMAAFTPNLLTAMRTSLHCDGFNLGTNVGSVAGAGIATHLHEHVVPRWTGDANFMPIIAGTKVLPELLPVTYAKLRAQLSPEKDHDTLAIVDKSETRVVVDAGGRLPSIKPMPNLSVWRSAVSAAEGITGQQATIVGWAGDSLANGCAPTLALTVVDPGAKNHAGDHHWVKTTEIWPEQASVVERAFNAATQTG
ncbi:MAG: HIT family protein [Chloroflexota bacterium]